MTFHSFSTAAIYVHYLPVRSSHERKKERKEERREACSKKKKKKKTLGPGIVRGAPSTMPECLDPRISTARLFLFFFFFFFLAATLTSCLLFTLFFFFFFSSSWSSIDRVSLASRPAATCPLLLPFSQQEDDTRSYRGMQRHRWWTEVSSRFYLPALLSHSDTVPPPPAWGTSGLCDDLTHQLCCVVWWSNTNATHTSVRLSVRPSTVGWRIA